MSTYPVEVRNACPPKFTRMGGPRRGQVGLGCGREVRTAAVQAGLVRRRLSFGYIFTSAAVMLLFVLIVFEYGI